jgi:predicted MFS family arabinose efflux permease
MHGGMNANSLQHKAERSFDTAVAGLLASWVSNRLGRRMTMIIGGAAFVLGSVLQAAAYEIVMLVIGRIVLGVGIGFANQVGLDTRMNRTAALLCYGSCLVSKLAIRAMRLRQIF